MNLILDIFLKRIALCAAGLLAFSCLLINPDVEPPTVTIESIVTSCYGGSEPVQNMLVCENVALHCVITDNSGLGNASLWIKGDTTSISPVPPLNDAESEYTLYWNTKDYNDGEYDIVVKAYDKNGNTGESTSLDVIVNNSGSSPDSMYIQSVVLLDTVFQISWLQTTATDFDHYRLERMDNFIDFDAYIPKTICETDSIMDVVCRDGEDNNGDGVLDEGEIIDPTINNYYRVYVYDTLGYVTAGHPYMALPDPDPLPIVISNAEYGNSNIYLEWDECEDNDFQRLYLFEAFNQYMEDAELIMDTTDQSITNFTVENILDNNTRWYQIVVEDIWGQVTSGPPLEANSFVRFIKSIGGDMVDVGMDVIQFGEQGFIITGYTESEGSGMEDGWIIHTELDGKETGKYITGGESRDILTSSIIPDNSGLFFAGRTESNGSGGIDGWLVKMNAEGEIVLDETYGGSEDDQIFKITETADQNELLLIGESSSYGQAANEIWVIKTDYNGAVLQEFTVGGMDRDYGRDIFPLLLGGYIILGETKSYGLGNYDVWLVRTDDNGEIVWDKSIGSSGQDYARRILQSTDGGYFILAVNGNPPDDEGPIWLIKTDLEGNISWSKYFGAPADNNPETPEDNGADMAFSSDGDLLIVGTTYMNGNPDIYFIKCDVFGNIIFERTYGEDADDHGLSISLVEDNGYIITGETQSYGAVGKNLILIKTDPYGGTVAYGEE